MNETDDDVELYTKTRDLAHSLDGSRPTVGAMAGRHDTTDYVQDVFSQNDYSASTVNGVTQPELLPPRTDRPYMVSETVGTLSGPAIYFRRTDPMTVQQGQAEAHARVLDIAASDDRYCAILPWSGYDYPSGSGNQYQGVKYTGVIDLFRQPKPGAAIYQAQLNPRRRPVIQPAFYWDFGPTSPVTDLGARAMICSNLDRLEIYLDGKHHSSATPDRSAFPHLAYAPSFVDFSAVAGTPDLRIDGYLGPAKVLSRSFAADHGRDRFVLAVDDRELIADGVDATRAAFRVVDAYGAIRPYVAGDVTMSVHGPGRLIGDNPFAAGDVGGVGAIWLRSLPNSPGTVRITATHPTLGRAAASIRVRPDTPGGRPLPYADLSALATPALVRPGGSSTVTARLTARSNGGLSDIALSLPVPAGWTATPARRNAWNTLRPGESVEAAWRVTAPAEAAAGSLKLTVRGSYAGAGQRGVSRTEVTLVVPYPDLPAAFTNTGISDDADVAAADFDGVGNSYSAQALAAAGLTPGGTLTYHGISLTWPVVPAGQPDNVLADGQAIALAGSGSTLVLLGAASSGNLGGPATVYYADGSSATVPLLLGDSFNPPIPGNAAVATMPYLNDSQGRTTGGVPGKRDHTVYVFAAAAPLPATGAVIGVQLPAVSGTVSGHTPAMHVFAVGLG